MVGAGTLSVTAMMYYMLPRILNRPLYSATLTNLSFFFTVLGVYSFYFVMLIEGVVLGGAVTRGIDYDTARHTLGAWYDAPTGIAGAIMGVGYWLFVANIYLTMRGPKSWKGPEAFIAKYIWLGTTGLFIGTLQGFYQVLPWSVDFIRRTGLAGEEIDPVAHAHINMVCGMAVTLMGMTYYVLPRLLGKPIWNLKLARTSFWFTTVGVLGFWLGLITLGIVEGNIDDRHHEPFDGDGGSGVRHGGRARGHLAQSGARRLWHDHGHRLLVIHYDHLHDVSQPGEHQSFPQNTRRGRHCRGSAGCEFAFHRPDLRRLGDGDAHRHDSGRHPDFAVRGDWIEAAGQAGDMITPLAHAQMNIIASIGFGLMGLVYFALPRLAGRPWASQQLIRLSFMLLVIGTASYYLSLLILGFIESNTVHQLLAAHPSMTELTAFNIARSEVGWAHPFWLVLSNCFIALGYIAYATNVAATLGSDALRTAIVDWVLNAAELLDRAVSVNRGQQARDHATLQRNTARTFVVELFAGCLGFVGAGWVISGRAGLGLGLFFSWLATWLIYVEWILSAQYALSFAFIAPLVPLYFGGVMLSAVCAALTYWRRGMRKAKKTSKTSTDLARIIESSLRHIDDAQPQSTATPSVEAFD